MSIDFAQIIAAELDIQRQQAARSIELFDSENTVPFVARYRKEVTGGLDEAQLRTILERLTYLRHLEARKETVLNSIGEQGKLTDELRSRIEAADTLQAVEDLYLPYKPKRRTRATIARALDQQAKVLVLVAEPPARDPRCTPINTDIKTPFFDWATLHEVGHAVDDKSGFMNANRGKSEFGGWQVHDGKAKDFAAIAAKAFKCDAKYIEKVLNKEKVKDADVPAELKQDDAAKALRQKVDKWCADVTGGDVWMDGARSKRIAEAIGDGRVYQVADHQGRAGRKRLYRELCALAPDALVMVCADVPIMTKWKWALAWNLPAKVLILNENGDFFWFDRAHWRVILHFLAFRSGLTGGGMVRTVADFALFPFTLGYLLLYAGWIHARRKVRLVIRGGV